MVRRNAVCGSVHPFIHRRPKIYLTARMLGMCVALWPRQRSFWDTFTCTHRCLRGSKQTVSSGAVCVCFAVGRLSVMCIMVWYADVSSNYAYNMQITCKTRIPFLFGMRKRSRWENARPNTANPSIAARCVFRFALLLSHLLARTEIY